MLKLRTDRFITTKFFEPLRRVGLGVRSTGKLPVLMYHSISDAGSLDFPGYYSVTTAPGVFERQMKLLHEEGYSVVGLNEGLNLLQQRGVKTNKLVALTFDDGFRDFFTSALPVLQKYGFSATIYLPTSFIGDKPLQWQGRDCMTWDEVRLCRKAKMEFGSHTMSHPKLVELGEEQIRRELEGSRIRLEKELGEPVNAFAYPYAFPSAGTAFVEKFKRLLKSTGYTTNVTTLLGRVHAGDSPFSLRRIPVNSQDDDEFFMAKVRGAYDWLALPQSTFKLLKRLKKPAQSRAPSEFAPASTREININQVQPNYFIVCPVRNEEKHLLGTIESIASQTVRPKGLILVNDGSTDRTEEIARAAMLKYDWITLISRTDRGFRQNGAGVINAFYDGFKLIEGESWDFLVKLDGDLSFAANYFARCFQKFEEAPQLGIGGGTCCVPTTGGPEVEFKGDPHFHVRGATKIYRRACWDDIDGLLRDGGWDTLDEVKANMLGWRTYTFADIRLIHHRKTGGADGGWKNAVKNGKAAYTVGYHPLFMLAKCLSRVLKQPFLVGGVGLFYGYFTGRFNRTPRIQDSKLVVYIQRQQLRRLLFLPSIWTDCRSRDEMSRLRSS